MSDNDTENGGRWKFWILMPIWLPLGILIYVVIAFLSGHVMFLAMALESGFVGLIAYVAGWVFMAPAMLVVAFIIGLAWPLM